MVNYKFIIIAVLGTFLIIYASSIPDITIVSSNNSIDRVLSNFAHIPVFACLSFLWLKSFPRTQNQTTALFILSGLVLFAVSDEFHQSMIPGRTAAISDFVLDVIGISLGFVAFKILDRINMIDRIS